MSSIDYFILAILAFSAILGFIRGLIKELMSLLAYVAAGAAALWWGPTMASWISHLIETSLLRSAIAYGLVFMVTLLSVGVVNLSLGAMITATGLGPADHGLGMVFGIIRGALFVLIMVLLAGYTQLPAEPWWQASSLVKTAIDALMSIKLYLPADIAAWLPY